MKEVTSYLYLKCQRFPSRGFSLEDCVNQIKVWVLDNDTGSCWLCLWSCVHFMKNKISSPVFLSVSPSPSVSMFPVFSSCSSALPPLLTHAPCLRWLSCSSSPCQRQLKNTVLCFSVHPRIQPSTFVSSATRTCSFSSHPPHDHHEFFASLLPRPPFVFDLIKTAVFFSFLCLSTFWVQNGSCRCDSHHSFWQTRSLVWTQVEKDKAAPLF